MSNNVYAVNSQDFHPSVELSSRTADEENGAIILLFLIAFSLSAASWICKNVYHGNTGTFFGRLVCFVP